MYNIGEIEREIYRLRSMHPLIIPQIDPDKYTKDNAKIWFENVKSNDISIIAMGGSMVDNVKVQELLNLAVADYDFKILLYLTNNTGSVKGIKGKTALYWTQVPYSTNTFYTWDGLVSNSLNVSKNNLEPLPTVYVFDERESRGTANWITRSTPIPRTKPEISLAVAKAAEYLGNRFYIMAGGSGSKNPPPIEHVSLISKKTSLFLIPTSGINTKSHADELFAAGADALHIGNRLEKDGGFDVLNEMVSISKRYKGKNFL